MADGMVAVADGVGCIHRLVNNIDVVFLETVLGQCIASSSEILIGNFDEVLLQQPVLLLWLPSLPTVLLIACGLKSKTVLECDFRTSFCSPLIINHQKLTTGIVSMADGSGQRFTMILSGCQLISYDLQLEDFSESDLTFPCDLTLGLVSFKRQVSISQNGRFFEISDFVSESSWLMCVLTSNYPFPLCYPPLPKKALVQTLHQGTGNLFSARIDNHIYLMSTIRNDHCDRNITSNFHHFQYKPVDQSLTCSGKKLTCIFTELITVELSAP